MKLSTTFLIRETHKDKDKIVRCQVERNNFVLRETIDFTFRQAQDFVLYYPIKGIDIYKEVDVFDREIQTTEGEAFIDYMIDVKRYEERYDCEFV